MSAYLTRDELAALLSVAPNRVAQWTKDGTIPADWYHVGDGKAFAYAPVTLALGLLILELESFLGKACPATKPAARRVAPILRRYWDDCGEGPMNEKAHALVRFTEDSDVEMKLPLAFLARARGLLRDAAAVTS